MNWYTTADIAKEFEVLPRTVERWRVSGYFVPERRTKGNHSRYSEEQVCLLKEKRNKLSLEQLML